MNFLFVMVLAFLQNVSFSLVSRSRNRDNLSYHVIAATLSNSIWFLTFRHLTLNNMDFSMFIPYNFGTVLGSVFGVKISMWIEQKLVARSDSHIK